MNAQSHARRAQTGILAFLLVLCALMPAVLRAHAAPDTDRMQVPASSEIAQAVVYDLRGGKVAFPITARQDIERLDAALTAAASDPAVRMMPGTGGGAADPNPAFTEAASADSGASLKSAGTDMDAYYAVALLSKSGAEYVYYVEDDLILPHLPAGGMHQGSRTRELYALLGTFTQRYAPTVDPMKIAPRGDASLARTQADSLHLYQNADKTFAAMDEAGIAEIAALLEKLPSAAKSADAVTDLGPALSAPDNMAVYSGATKLTYTFYQNGMTVSTETAKGWNIPQKRLSCSGAAYQELTAALGRLYQASDKGSYWLGMMRTDRLRQVTLHSRFMDEDRRVDDTYRWQLETIADELKGLCVAGESYQKITDGKWQDNPDYEFTLKFDGNITYTVTIAAGQLQVYSNDVGYAIRHNLSKTPDLTEIRKLLKRDPKYDEVRRNPGQAG